MKEASSDGPQRGKGRAPAAHRDGVIRDAAEAPGVVDSLIQLALLFEPHDSNLAFF